MIYEFINEWEWCLRFLSYILAKCVKYILFFTYGITENMLIILTNIDMAFTVGQILIGLNNENLKSDIMVNAERSQRQKSKQQPPLTLATSHPRSQAPISTLPYHFLSLPSHITPCFLFLGAEIKGVCHHCLSSMVN